MHLYKVGDAVHYHSRYKIATEIIGIENGEPGSQEELSGPYFKLDTTVKYPDECYSEDGCVYATVKELLPFSCPNCNNHDPSKLGPWDGDVDGEDIECRACGFVF